MGNKINNDYLDKLYAGWLGKIIGVRHGANIEGWTYKHIQDTFGEITTYLYDFKNFAADDDINGPIFFLRALEDYTCNRKITPEEMGLNLLNYVCDGHGFFWWGGYGKSTEHTAYLNLKAGIKAPLSGSCEMNGTAVAEQIGGQIFIDCWGLVNPGNPLLAAEYAEKMSSVMHGGNGIYGGKFIAACISEAFIEKNIMKIINTGLGVIPENCEYTLMVKSVINFYQNNTKDWRKAFHYVEDNFGYHLYPGNCHIMPNSAIIILSLLYGNGNFSRTINIGNMCGWDTDCNVGNLGTILGVLNGTDGIEESWKTPINDFVCASSVLGSLNMLDIPTLVTYTAKLAYKIAGVKPKDKWQEIFNEKNRYFHFEYPGSTHSFRGESDERQNCVILINNTEETSHSGNRSLKITVPKAHLGNAVRTLYKTYYIPSDFNDNRYDPEFSPVLYPGQIIQAWTMIPTGMGFEAKAVLYIKDLNSEKRFYGDSIQLRAGEWTKIVYDIPIMKNVVIGELGVEYIPTSDETHQCDFTMLAYLDDVKLYGKANYSIDFSNEHMEKWSGMHQVVSQQTNLRGIWILENGELSGSYFGESAENYTGDFYWEDYEFEASVIPKLGGFHNISFRVEGAIKSYAVGLAPDNNLTLYKNDNGYKELAKVNFNWTYDKPYKLKVRAEGKYFTIYVDGTKKISYTDENNAYLMGQIGFSNTHGSHTHYNNYSIKVL